VRKEAEAIGRGDCGKSRGGGMEQFIAGAWTQASEPLFDFAPHVFNGVEIRGIGWQISVFRFIFSEE
jgi:hypothetical protein